MGMFDYVDIAIKCPKCGNFVKNFQTKDKSCCMNHLKYWEVDNFYCNCDKCNTWIEFHRKREIPKVPLSDFDMEYKVIGEEAIYIDGNLINTELNPAQTKE
jgi:hypothetical protein